MSDNWITLVPVDPYFVPTDKAADFAEEHFHKIAPDVEEVEQQRTDEIRFFDCGANFERINCPSCESVIPIEWWQQHLDRDAVGGFKLNKYKVPCCSAEHDLNQLEYDWPQAFGRFSLEAMNPNIGELPKAELAEFERILETPMRVIYQHI